MTSGSPSVGGATALSLALHVLLFVLASVFARESARMVQTVYTVSIVTPETAPQKEAAALPPPEPVRQPRVEPPPPPPNPAQKKAAEKPEQAAKVNNTPAYDPVAAMKKRKEVEQELQSGIERVRESKEKSEAVSRLASDKTAASASQPNASAERQEKLRQYVERIKAPIYRAWVYPDIDIANLEAVISIKILKDGTIDVRGVKSSSGSRLFDGSAIKALIKARQVEPPPADVPTDDVTIKFRPEDIR